MNLKVIPYKLYVLTSSLTSDSKTLGALTDAAQRLFKKEKLRESREFFEENAGRAECVASMLADQKSRDAYRALIRYRCYKKRRYIRACLKNPRVQIFERFFRRTR